MPSVYETTTLLEVLSVQKVPKPYWLTKFFPNQINFETKKIAFDRVNEDFRRMAPFVVPTAQGQLMDLSGYDTIEFQPAYVKPKHKVTPEDVTFVRRPGEALGTGSLSPAQRKDAAVADILRRHREMHVMTQEVLAAKAIMDGKVTIVGENYPSTLVDFRRDASATVTLTGTAKWDAPTTANPLADIYAARANANVLCGAVIRDVIFDPLAWAKFIAVDSVKALLDKNYANNATNIAMNQVDGFEDTTEYMGEIKSANGNGAFRAWVYNAQYRNSANVLTKIMDDNTVVGVDPTSVQGFRCFGAIEDLDAELKAVEMFPKSWREDDPSAEYVMTQSAPLMIPKQPNATFKIKVA